MGEGLEYAELFDDITFEKDELEEDLMQDLKEYGKFSKWSLNFII